MRILHLSTWKTGGSAIAAARLSSTLNQLGETSEIIHMSNRLPSYLDAVIGKLTHTANPIFHSYNYFGEDISKKVADFKPDLIHVHWIGAGFVTPESLKHFNLPIVWTLHDLWPLCGAEHLPGSDRIKLGYLYNNRPVGERGLDLDRYIWDRKKRAFKNANITFVAPSSYVYELAKSSKSLGKHKLIKISNGIDIDIFKPGKKNNSDKQVVLFVAMNPELDLNKGYADFVQAIQLLPEKIRANIEIRVIGGEITSDFAMAKEYAHAAVTVIPSKIETLSYVAMESLACGTPVVAYKTGGIPDLVEHKINGYLAKPFNIKDLSLGIEKIVSKSPEVKFYGQNGRQKIIQQFDIQAIAKQYMDIYRKV